MIDDDDGGLLQLLHWSLLLLLLAARTFKFGFCSRQNHESRVCLLYSCFLHLHCLRLLTYVPVLETSPCVVFPVSAQQCTSSEASELGNIFQSSKTRYLTAAIPHDTGLLPKN